MERSFRVGHPFGDRTQLRIARVLGVGGLIGIVLTTSPTRWVVWRLEVASTPRLLGVTSIRFELFGLLDGYAGRSECFAALRVEVHQ